jgi:hypothetical protein
MSTEHQLVDLSKSIAELKIIGIAGVPKIVFETNSMVKRAKYSYRTRTISMTAASSKKPLAYGNLYLSNCN